MKKCFICSPFRGDIPGNTRRAEQYCKLAIRAGYLPIAPHLYFTRFFNEDNLHERNMGIEMGIELLRLCDEMWVFGAEPTEGMRCEIMAWLGSKGDAQRTPIKYMKEDL
jgi:hypothetical protein